MKEWSDEEWRKIFEQEELEVPQKDEWFTRRVMNRLPPSRWSVQAWVQLAILVAVALIGLLLLSLFMRELQGDPCWTCLHTWILYVGALVPCILWGVQLDSFLQEIDK